MTKHLLLLAGLIMLSLQILIAQQVPQAFSYQAIARDNAGVPLANQQIQVELSVVEDNINGPVVYSEEYELRTNQYGLFTIEAGNGLGSGDFEEIDWENHRYFIRTRMINENGVDLGGTLPILSVPYAIVAQRVIEDRVNDADADPANEIQQMARENDRIVLSGGGGSVPLNDDDPANELQTITKSGNEIILSDGGRIVDEVEDADADPSNELQRLAIQEDTLSLLGEGLPSGVRIPHVWRREGGLAYYDRGNVEIRDGRSLSWLGRSGAGLAKLQIDGNQSAATFDFSNSSGANRLLMGTSGALDIGFILTRGANNELNHVLGILNPLPNHGLMGVYGEGGNTGRALPDAALYIDAAGLGIVAASGAKNFYMPHPKDTSQQIWYAAVEGPEAAAYERGTAQLQNGEAFVPFSEHFQLVVNPETMTVQLTPQSADTYGLAVVEKTAKGFQVKELMGRKGNFQFDWEVKAVRQGFERYRVIRSTKDYMYSVEK